jgi:hypothetical protein
LDDYGDQPVSDEAPKFLEIIARLFPEAEAYTSVPFNYTYNDIVWITDPIPESVLMDARLDLVKSLIKGQVNVYRDAHLNKGFWFQGYLYDSSEIARTNTLGGVAAILLGETLPPDFTWRDSFNNDHPFDNDRMRAFGLQMLKWVTYVFQVSWYIKEQIELQTDPLAVKNFPINNYWPDNNFDLSKPAEGDPLPPL